MALSAADSKKLRTFVAKNYAPKLRRNTLKKFTVKAKANGLGFIDEATARKKAKGKTGTGATGVAAPPPGDYDRFKGLPGAIEGIKRYDRERGAHQEWAQKVQAGIGGTLTALQQQGAAAAQGYASMAGSFAGMGAMPGYMPNATAGGGSVVTPGIANNAINAANIQGQGLAAAGSQAAAYQGYMADQSGRTLTAGIMGSLGEQMTQIPATYNAAKQAYIQRLDENLLEIETANREMENERAINDAKMANDRYIAQTRLIGTLTGTQAKVGMNDADNRTSLATNAADNQTRANVAAMDNDTRRAIADQKSVIERAKLAVTKAKGTAAKGKANTALLRQVQKSFDTLWQGEPGDAIAGVAPTGWRHTARSGDKSTRAKATLQVLGWLQSTGLAPVQMHRLMRSKGFTDAEFAAAARQIESGGGF